MDPHGAHHTHPHPDVCDDAAPPTAAAAGEFVAEVVLGRDDAGEDEVEATPEQQQPRSELLAELYSIIHATQRLEVLYVKGVDQGEYSSMCSRLIADYQRLQKMLGGVDFDDFCKEHGLLVKMARRRLVEEGTPAPQPVVTIGGPRPPGADVVMCFIMATDSVKLGMTAVDEVFPILKDLIDSFGSVTAFDGREKLAEWVSSLAGRMATDQLDASETAQLLEDLKSGYASLMKVLTSS